MSVVDNSSKLESTLNKKHSSIAYNLVRWNVAAIVVQIGWIEVISNIADALKEILARGNKVQVIWRLDLFKLYHKSINRRWCYNY